MNTETNAHLLCTNGACCMYEGLSCGNSGECCAGLTCKNYACWPACQPPGDVCGPQIYCCNGGSCRNNTCCTEGALPCQNDGDCCSGNCATSPDGGAKTCVPACKTDREQCTDASECCNGFCRDGLCASQGCYDPGELCDADTDCCTGKCGPDGKCQKANGADCGSNDECLSGTCCRGKCYGGVCESCYHYGESCSSTSQCCSGLVCFAAGGSICFN
jgi:hypothetical protein